MRIFNKTALAFLAIFSMVMNTTAASIKVGQPFPNIILPSLEDGRSRSIHEFHGEKLMLHLFASW
jgi:hypothetical protein